MEYKYVLFRVGEVRYAINLEYAVQIFRNQNILDVPRAPRYVEGVVNVRGGVVPVINMRERFGLTREENEKKKRIVVIKIEDHLYGLLVDDVREIVDIKEEVVDRNVTSVFGLRKNMIEGIAKLNNKLIIILSIKEVVNSKGEIKIAK